MLEFPNVKEWYGNEPRSITIWPPTQSQSRTAGYGESYARTIRNKEISRRTKITDIALKISSGNGQVI